LKLGALRAPGAHFGAKEAKSMSAEISQFEPYWYLFDNGEPRGNVRLLMEMLT